MTMLQHLTTSLARLMPTPSPAPSGFAPLFAVRLINRLTGEMHRVEGRILTVFTHHPEAACDLLLHRRDRRNWRSSVEAVTVKQGGRR